MSLIDRFQAYADAFEATMVDDDWTRLEPYFTDDAVYKSDTPPFTFSAEGRAAVFEQMKSSVDGFDRRFDGRKLEVLGVPEERDGAVHLKWAVTYSLAGAPDVRMTGTEVAAFEGDRIKLLEDAFDGEAVVQVGAWMQEHGEKLPS